MFVLADNDSFNTDSLEYEHSLEGKGISTEVKAYKNVKYGFIEQNNPEYNKLYKINRTSKLAETEIVVREAKNYIRSWIKNNLNNNN